MFGLLELAEEGMAVYQNLYVLPERSELFVFLPFWEINKAPVSGGFDRVSFP